MRILTITLIIAASIGATQLVSADTVTLDAAADNTLYENGSGSLSNGAGQYFFAGATGDGLTRRGLLRFDLTTAAIPAGSTITDVQLVLRMSRTRAAATDVALHRLLNDWGEGTSDAAGEEGEGIASTPDDATWLHTFFDTGLWSSPGGDFAAAASASVAVGDTADYTWTSAAMVADAQDWLDGLAANHGWAIIGVEAGSRTAKRFNSRENTASPPRLTIVYTPPAFGACCDGAGSCSEVAPGACTGTYQGDGTVCGAGGTCGACCDGVTCDLRVAATCATTYIGDGTVCTPDPCSTPRPGACCQGDGTCSDVIAADCTGTFQGEGTACGAGGTCGACCDGTTCEETVASTCTGTYEGDATSCATDPCAGDTGACCRDTSCSDGLLATECAAIGGEYQGDGQTCATDPCGDESRACCFPDESCVVMNRDQCEAMGGDDQGGSSTCAEKPCAPIGACCMPGDVCIDDLEHDDCENMGGDFAGGIGCDTNPCGEVRACCLPAGGGCEMLDERVCDGMGGTHLPVGTTCTPDPCGGAPCDVTSIAPVRELRAVKMNRFLDVHLSWTPDADADGYNVWYVPIKTDIPMARSTGPAISVAGCLGAPAAECQHAGAVDPASGTHLYYNVIGACGGTEAAE